ncbi:polysaccharide lyase 6 family protein [Isoptericola sp. QY 916]|uniref:polysaccharide lyase 6 family protein n=1 Tax=Isoptericola sp. QY 916 TaxID=2782570 RepID=UPI003D2FF763|nr:polysaccharide lyase 6 family protein [Isoptericola sp. QY 916]
MKKHLVLPLAVALGLSLGTAAPAGATAVAPAASGSPAAADDADPAPQRTVRVSTSAELAAAFQAALPGDRIVLADGEYTMVKLADKAGTAGAPVVVEGATLGGAVVTAGQLEVARSSHVVVRGLTFRNATTLKITASTHVRFTRNDVALRFEPPADPTSSRHWLQISGEGSGYHRIDHNAFHDKTLMGNYVTVYGGATQISQHDRIDHNWFADSPAQPINGGEAIRLGVSALSDSSSFAVVEHNVFENTDSDPEIVSIKSDDNTVRFNTVRRSAGAFVARRGDRNVIQGNVFLGEGKAGTGGVRLYGDDQLVFDNYFEGLRGSGYTAALQIDGGDVDGSGSTSAHWRVHRATVVHNTFVDNTSNIEVGANYVLPPVDSLVADNLVVGSAGPLFQELKQPSGVTYSGNVAWPTGAATLGIDAAPREVRVADPLLVRSGGLWRLRPGPAMNTAVGTYPFLVDDVDGQPRDVRPDVGADEVSSAPVTRRPLERDDVGPAAP